MKVALDLMHKTTWGGGLKSLCHCCSLQKLCSLKKLLFPHCLSSLYYIHGLWSKCLEVQKSCYSLSNMAIVPKQYVYVASFCYARMSRCVVNSIAALFATNFMCLYISHRIFLSAAKHAYFFLDFH